MSTAHFKSCTFAAGCAESALSYSEYCWSHLVDSERWLTVLVDALKDMPADPVALNLKKVEARGLDFSHLNLRGSSFSQAHLSDTLFVGSDLGSADMIGARFHGCDFVGGDMKNSNFTRAALNHCSFSYADLRGAYFVEAQFKEVDLMGAILYDAVLWNSDLSGAKHLKKRNFIDPDDPHKCALSETNTILAYESYRLLKHHLYDKGLYEDGSWAAYRELTMERRHFFKTRDARYFPSLMMDLVSGYTEKPNRVILSAFLIVLAFGVAYYLLNVPVPSADMARATRTGFLECFYFSFITFTTVGYGDLIPRPVAGFQLLACVEAFSGPFMAGLYVFTLTRRYAAS